MADDKSPAWRTAISDPRADTIVIRGYDLADLLAEYDFAAIVFLVVRGQLPDADKAAVFDAIISASVDHGISPTQAVSRFVASEGLTTPAAVATGLLMCGDHHGGAGEAAARLLETGVDQATEPGESVEDVAAAIVDEHLANGDRIPGYGHTMHPEEIRGLASSSRSQTSTTWRATQ